MIDTAANHTGLLSLLPTAITILVALITRRPILALLVGAAFGHVLISGTGVVPSFVDGALAALADETMLWIGLLVGLFGILMGLVERAGGFYQFGEIAVGRIRTRTQAVFVTWLMGIVLFIDEYLNVLVIGTAMKRVTDGLKISRQMLAYIIDSTGAPVCVLIPLSSWSIYVIGLIEGGGYAARGDGLSLYIQSIPYMLYPIVAIVLVPLVAARWLPLVGPMREFERVAEQGESIPIAAPTPSPEAKESTSSSHWSSFVVPLAMLVVTLFAFDMDLLRALFATTVLSALFLMIARFLNLAQASTASLQGFQAMVPVLAIILIAFMLRDVNETLGLAAFVIESVQPIMSPLMMPALTFVVMAFIAFATGSFWGVYAIAMPIVVPLGEAMGVPLPLVLGSLVSAGAFGSHTCFFGDATALSARAVECPVIDHAVSQFPYALMTAVVAVLGLVGITAVAV